MDFVKTNQIGTDYKDRRTPPLWETRVKAQVVFIDKSHDNATSQLYQLKDNVLSLDSITSSNGTPLTPHDAFLHIGEVAFINKKSKEVHLKNQNVVAYDYLVVVAGQRSLFNIRQEEFSAGLQALCDAIRVKPKIPSSFADLSPRRGKNPYGQHPEVKVQNPCENMNQLASTKINDSGNRDNTLQLDAINKRLFEVQL